MSSNVITAFMAISTKLNQALPEWFIDLDVGQLEDLAARSHPLPPNAAFLEFSQTDWEDRGSGRQHGRCRLTVRTSLQIMGDSYLVKNTPSQSRQATIDRMNEIQQVYLALQGFSGASDSGFTALVRVREVVERKDDGRHVFAQVFEFFLEDDSACSTDESNWQPLIVPTE